jgi:hypothetical protein
MKRQIATLMTGVVLVMSATTLSAFATGSSYTITQPLLGGAQQTQMPPKMGDRMHQQKWIVDEKGAKVLHRLTPSERAKFDRFKAGIEKGLSPGRAARNAGGKLTMLTMLGSTNNQPSKVMVRLSLDKKASVTFIGDVRAKVLTVQEVGSGVEPV